MSESIEKVKCLIVGSGPAINLSIPIIVGPGQIINGSGNINGYLTELNYF